MDLQNLRHDELVELLLRLSDEMIKDQHWHDPVAGEELRSQIEAVIKEVRRREKE